MEYQSPAEMLDGVQESLMDVGRLVSWIEWTVVWSLYAGQADGSKVTGRRLRTCRFGD